MQDKSTARTVQIPLRARDGGIRAYAVIDEVDADLADLHWSLGDTGYAQRAARLPDGRRTIVRLHREVLGLSPGDGFQVDHINRDRLDCRRPNLRVVTHAQNGQNVTPMAGRSSRHRGVSWHASVERWRAAVVLDGRQHHLGLFDTEDEAAEAARAFRAKHMPYCSETAA